MPQPSDRDLAELEAALDEVRRSFMLKHQTPFGRGLMLTEVRRAASTGRQVAMSATVSGDNRLDEEFGGRHGDSLAKLLEHLRSGGKGHGVFLPNENSFNRSPPLGDQVRTIYMKQRPIRNESRTQGRFKIDPDGRLNDKVQPGFRGEALSGHDQSGVDLTDWHVAHVTHPDEVFGTPGAGAGPLDELPDKARELYLKLLRGSDADSGSFDEIRARYDKRFRDEQAQRQFPEN